LSLPAGGVQAEKRQEMLQMLICLKDNHPFRLKSEIFHPETGKIIIIFYSLITRR
jgi:hypothetical protein